MKNFEPQHPHEVNSRLAPLSVCRGSRMILVGMLPKVYHDRMILDRLPGLRPRDQGQTSYVLRYFPRAGGPRPCPGPAFGPIACGPGQGPQGVGAVPGPCALSLGLGSLPEPPAQFEACALGRGPGVEHKAHAGPRPMDPRPRRWIRK